jgi:hypothetical protein
MSRLVFAKTAHRSAHPCGAPKCLSKIVCRVLRGTSRDEREVEEGDAIWDTINGKATEMRGPFHSPKSRSFPRLPPDTTPVPSAHTIQPPWCLGWPLERLGSPQPPQPKRPVAGRLCRSPLAIRSLPLSMPDADGLLRRRAELGDHATRSYTSWGG